MAFRSQCRAACRSADTPKVVPPKSAANVAKSARCPIAKNGDHTDDQFALHLNPIKRDLQDLRTGATGLEPATSGVTGRRSNQLSYAP
jgi:hypothetical protein